MTVNLVLFLILATVAVISALGMLLSRNAVYSALFLVLNFATVAVFYLLLGAPFIAITQVTVYAGAIMVLFLFVIMLLGADPLPEGDETPPVWQKPLAVALALILTVEGIFLIATQKSAGIINAAPVESTGSPQAIGDLLFNQYLLPFEVTSILLLVAMVGAIVLTHKEKGGQS